MKTFVLGDSHGAYRALKQVLEKSSFDYENDRLICLGDVADGWPEVPELIEELMKIKNLVFIRGNHDQWLKDFLKEGKQPDVWVLQGGASSKDSYLFRRPELMKKHLEFLVKNRRFYFVDEENRCYVHGGLEPGVPMNKQNNQVLMWDRRLWDERHRSDQKRVLTQQFKEIYCGHTSIYHFSHKPINYMNVWFMDTGGGWEGVLSLMNVDTKEVFQSDVVQELYPETRGRNAIATIGEVVEQYEKFKDVDLR